MTTLDMLGRSRVWAVALLAAVFVAGGAGGWALGRHHSGGAPRGGSPDAIAAYLARRLDLTPVQQDSVRAVFVRHHAEMQTIWGAVRPRLDSLRAAVRTEVNAQLTPDQQARYARLLADLEHQRGEREGRDTTTSKQGQH
ncbi:MAG TPA: periplasmic heavy metal sensor [Gemmatimonadales bacterium]|nr:periplasmic heavy metal sensor [Gemmatimonadales bacterium]